MYKPTSKFERHQDYLSAFSFFILETEYLDVITKFITDHNMKSSNEDDIELFRDLLFEGAHGKIHIIYYYKLFEIMNSINESVNIYLIARYAEFLNQASELHLIDLFYYIIYNANNKINILMKEFSSEVRVKFVQVLGKYPDIVKQIPKIKLYLLFS